MKVLISVDPLTDLISDLLVAGLGSGYVWPYMPIHIVREAIDHYNAAGMDTATSTLTDAFTKKGLWTMEHIPRIDAVCAEFGLLFNNKANTTESKVLVEYDEASNAAIVTVVAIKVDHAQVHLDNLKDSYRHAVEHCDFIPERLRRAFDEILR